MSASAAPHAKLHPDYPWPHHEPRAGQERNGSGKDQRYEYLLAKFRQLPNSIRNGFRDVRSHENPRQLVDLWLRQLRHNGWTLAEAIEWSRFSPLGFGILEDLTAKIFEETWKQFDEDEAKRAEADRKLLKPRAWAWRDPTTIPPRQWLVGTFLLRGYTTLLGGSGGVGKTATGVGAALAYITGRRDILDMHVFQTGRVWINVLEDDLDELDRRIHAAMIAHNISRDDIEGELFVNTADQRPILLAHLNPETGVFEVSADAKALEDGIKDMRIGLTMIDPLVKAHKVTENSNEHMDQLITMGNDMARRTRSALLINTHFRKGGAEGGNRDAFRGGGSLVDGGRINRSLAPMSEDEAQMYKIDPDEAFRYVKIVDAKGNLAPKARATWIRLASIEIDNREVDPRYPAGDNVQAAVAWKPPPLFDGLDHGPLLRIFDALREGPGESWHYSAEPRAKHWAGQVLVRIGNKSRDEARAILTKWLKSELIREEEWNTPSKNKATRLVLNEDKIVEMLSFLHRQPQD